MACIKPCPTGAVDHWIPINHPFSIEDQLAWGSLPRWQGDVRRFDSVSNSVPEYVEDIPDPIDSSGVRAPKSASSPTINLWTQAQPAKATVVGNLRVTDPTAVSDVRHIILDFGDQPFPYLEGQTIGISPPGSDSNGNRHSIRLYSVASARDGEKPNSNNVAIIVKRVVEPRVEGEPFRGVASNWLCDLTIGDSIAVVGPFGVSFLLPEDPDANVLMICTGTGGAPFRGFVHRRRRVRPHAKGRYLIFFGARTPGELPHFGPLQTVPPEILDKELVYSRLPGRRKEYVQDRLRRRASDIAVLLSTPQTHIYVCGLRGLEDGVERAFTEIGRKFEFDWLTLRETMRWEGRYHIETY